MSYTKNEKIKCDICGLLCIPFDEETPFGCTYDGDGTPEPLDPYHYCSKCYPKLKEKWFKSLTENPTYGYWQKSKAERLAAEKLGLVWSTGIGVLGSKKKWEDSYKYITRERFNELKDLPYYGWCNVCGNEKSGGYCGDEKCEDSFKSKNDSILKD